MNLFKTLLFERLKVKIFILEMKYNRFLFLISNDKILQTKGLIIKKIIISDLYKNFRSSDFLEWNYTSGMTKLFFMKRFREL